MGMGDLLEWSAFGVGTVGTVLWAAGYKWKGKPVEGWFWLVSALLWIGFAVIHNHNGLAARDLLGVVLYVYGIYTAMRGQGTVAAAPVVGPASEPVAADTPVDKA
jgi:hypothetical protein